MSRYRPRPRPPRDITPRDFFERWLPGLYAEHARRVDPLDLRMRILDGATGAAATWDIRTGGPALVVESEAPGERPVTITMTERDWRALACGEEGAFDLAPPRGGPLDLLFVDPGMRHLVDESRGAVRVELPGYNDRTWAALLKLGEQPAPDAPDATITIAAPTYEEILAGRLPPAEAYFTGRVGVSGNLELAMQVAMALLPRFAGG